MPMTSCSSATPANSSTSPRSATTRANEFIRRFVAAGGILKEGSDPPRGMAALLMHQALVMDVEAGVPPMAAIQAATLNVAKTFGKDKDYGSVEPGKVADLSIIEGDPLEDIWMTQNVKMVVMDGKVVDIAFQQIQESDSLVLLLPDRCRRRSMSHRTFSETGPMATTLTGNGTRRCGRFTGSMLNGGRSDRVHLEETSSRLSFRPRRSQRPAPTSSQSRARANRCRNRSVLISS